jgi:hypothetical protein
LAAWHWRHSCWPNTQGKSIQIARTLKAMIVTGYHRVLFAKAATEQALLWSQENKTGANVLALVNIDNGAS